MNRPHKLYRITFHAEDYHGYVRTQNVVAQTAQEAIAKSKPDSDEYAASVEILTTIDIL